MYFSLLVLGRSLQFIRQSCLTVFKTVLLNLLKASQEVLMHDSIVRKIEKKYTTALIIA